MTNADKLRHLSDEELAAWLSPMLRHYCPSCPMFQIEGCPIFAKAVERAEKAALLSGKAVDVKPNEKDCVGRILGWLYMDQEDADV